MTEPIPNIELLDKVIEAIDAEPERWNQGVWADFGADAISVLVSDDAQPAPHRVVDCGTSFCVAGWAAHLSGARFIDGESVIYDQNVDNPYEATPYYEHVEVRRHGRIDKVLVGGVPVWARARVVLGLTDREANSLFSAGLGRRDLKEVTDSIRERATKASHDRVTDQEKGTQ